MSPAAETLKHVGLRAGKLVYRVKGLGPGQRLTLGCIASHCDRYGRGARASIKRMAAETGTSAPSIKRAIRDLELLGVLRVTRRGYLNSNAYEVVISVLEALPMVGDKRDQSDPTIEKERAHVEPTLVGQATASRCADRDGNDRIRFMRVGSGRP